MDQPLRIREHQEVYCTFTPPQVAVLRKSPAGIIDLTPTGEENRYRLRTGSHVGFVSLPDDRTLIIEPKISVQNIFYLLAMVYDPSKDFLREEKQAYTTIKGLFEFIVRIFLDHVEDLITRGVLRGYRSKVDDLTAIRGRLLIAETVHRRPVVRDRHWCDFSHFTADIKENIILRSTAFVLRAFPYQDRTIPAWIRRLQRFMAEVSIDPDPIRLYEKIEYHRLNDPYRPALNLAKILLNHISLSGTAGEEPFLTFLIDMDWLFEKVVGIILRRYARNLGVSIREQKNYSLDKASQVKVKPDVILYRDHQPILVIDAKYKLQPNQADLYQILAYCHALGLHRSALVHPIGEETHEGTVSFLGPGNIKSEYLSLDLRGDPSQIEEQGFQFVQQVQMMLEELT